MLPWGPGQKRPTADAQGSILQALILSSSLQLLLSPILAFGLFLSFRNIVTNSEGTSSSLMDHAKLSRIQACTEGQQQRFLASFAANGN